MGFRFLASALMLVLAAAAQATELDRLRELDRVRQDEHAAFERGFRELARLEPERIRAENGRVVREGDELALALGKGGRTFYRNDQSQCLEGLIPSRDDGCVSFFFVGHVGRFYVLRARYYAGSDYRLIDDTIGTPTTIPGEPHVSPDGTRLVTVLATGTYDPAGIEVWTLGASAPAREWRHEPKQYALYYFVRWDGNDRIVLEVKTYVGHELQRLPAQLVLGESGWMLQGPPETSRF